MKKDTKIKSTNFSGKNDTVEILFSQLVGENSRANFRINMDENTYFRLYKNKELEKYLDDAE